MSQNISPFIQPVSITAKLIDADSGGLILYPPPDTENYNVEVVPDVGYMNLNLPAFDDYTGQRLAILAPNFKRLEFGKPSELFPNGYSEIGILYIPPRSFASNGQPGTPTPDCVVISNGTDRISINGEFYPDTDLRLCLSPGVWAWKYGQHTDGVDFIKMQDECP